MPFLSIKFATTLSTIMKYLQVLFVTDFFFKHRHYNSKCQQILTSVQIKTKFKKSLQHSLCKVCEMKVYFSGLATT